MPAGQGTGFSFVQQQAAVQTVSAAAKILVVVVVSGILGSLVEDFLADVQVPMVDMVLPAGFVSHRLGDIAAMDIEFLLEDIVVLDTVEEALENILVVPYIAGEVLANILEGIDIEEEVLEEDNREVLEDIEEALEYIAWVPAESWGLVDLVGNKAQEDLQMEGLHAEGLHGEDHQMGDLQREEDPQRQGVEDRILDLHGEDDPSLGSLAAGKGCSDNRRDCNMGAGTAAGKDASEDRNSFFKKMALKVSEINQELNKMLLVFLFFFRRNCFF